jgi:heme/copper-type cytochrome/quinol oxidase subunit 4
MSDPKAAIGASSAHFQRHFNEWFRRHGEALWWLHSIYALALGIGVMWLGNRNFAYLRVATFHIGFIWFSSLLLPKFLTHPRLTPAWAPKLQLVVNYFNKNLYQQMLFFVLPIYYASATFGSRNMGFVVLVGLSAILSTLDIIYDRHLSVKRRLTAGFFAFNLFALINVMLPIVWSISNTLTTRVSGMVAFLGFLTLGYPDSPSVIRRIAVVIGAAVFILAAGELGRSFIPPAPLRLASAEFGTDFERESLQVVSPVTELKPIGSLPLYGLTAIKAPLGLREMLQHRWYVNGKLICASPFYNVVGGRQEGFRLWTSCVFDTVPSGTELRLDLETEGGQLVGRARLKSKG